MNTHLDADPMREKPAEMLPAMPAERVKDLTYEYDFLANMVSWDSDENKALALLQPARGARRL